MATADASTYGPREGFLTPLPAVERGVAVVTSASPCGKYFLYCNGYSVVVRSVEDPSLSFVYSEHTQAVKVAKFAPSGKYIASGDASGKIRIWSFTTADHALKFEFQALGGEIEDIAWDAESKRLLAVGGGSSRAKFFMWDTGSNLGEVIPHSKKNLTCDFKSSRPFRAVMGGEDFQLSFYAGPPFKYDHGVKEHTNFVNCVRYAPDGSKFVSVSSDKQGLVLHGETGTVMGKLDPASMHSGSIYSCAWKADSTQLVTSSADKSLKVWNMTGEGPTFPCVATFTLGKAAEDMQNGVTWATPETIISTSLDGTINVVAAGAGGAEGSVTQRVQGHQGTALCFAFDAASGQFVSGDSNGRVCLWSPTNEAGTKFIAKTATGQVAAKRTGGVALAGGEFAAASWDDKLRIGDAATGELKTTVALPGQPKGLAVSAAAPTLRVVATGSAVLSFKGGVQVSKIDAAWGPACVDVSADATTVAVGGNDKKVHFYKMDASGTLTADGETKEAGAGISVVGFSPDGSKVAAGDALREVRLFSTGAGKDTLVSARWMNHTTRVTGLKWSPDGKHIATVSTDRRLVIWDPSADSAKLSIDLAYPQPFAGVTWTDANTIWTLGADGVACRRVLAL